MIVHEESYRPYIYSEGAVNHPVTLGITNLFNYKCGHLSYLLGE